MGCLRLWAWLGIVLVLGGCVPLPLTPAPAYAQSPGDSSSFSISITFSPDICTVTPWRSQSDVAEFWGEVTTSAVSDPYQIMTVNLSASSIWPTTFSQRTMWFQGNETRRFYMLVTIPPRTNVTTDTVQVLASATGGAHFENASAECTVIVAQYFSFDIRAIPSWAELPPPPIRVQGVLIIENRGNGPDTFRVSLVNCSDGLISYYLDGSLSMGPNSTKVAIYSIIIERTRGTERGGLFNLSFMVTSMGATAKGLDYSQFQAVQFYIRPHGMEPPERDPEYLGWAICLGALVAITSILVWRQRQNREG